MVIFGIRGIRGSTDSEIPCQSRALPRQRRAAEEVGARRAAVCSECVSAWSTVPALPHDRSGASLGKSKISDFGIFVMRFGLICRSLPSAVTIGGTFRFFCRIYPKISIFDFHSSGKRTRRTRGGPGGLPRWSLPTQNPLHHQKPSKP